MKSAVLVFPGINRERDMARALKLASGKEAAMVWHAETALPKGTDLSVYDQQALDSIADLMNSRPRETLGWRSPIQAFAELMQRLTTHAQPSVH